MLPFGHSRVSVRLAASVTTMAAVFAFMSCGTDSTSPSSPDNPDSLGIPDPIDFVEQNLRAKYEGDCVFCFVDGSEPGMPTWSDENGGFLPQEDDLRQQVVIDQNFTVESGEQFTFSDEIVWIRPTARQDIQIHGTLIVENSLLLWDQTEHQQTRLRVKNGGTLQMTDSYAFSSDGWWLNWEFESGSTVRFDGFVGDPWTAIAGAVDYQAINFSTVNMTLLNNIDGSSLVIHDAHHLWFEIFPPSDMSTEISFEAKHQWIDWTINSMWPNTTVEVEDSYLYDRGISISPGNHVTVRDTPDGFSFGWAIYSYVPEWVECEIEGMGDPDNDDGVLYENRTWSLPCINSSLTLINTKLERVWPTTWGNVHLTVRNTNLADPRVWNGPATYEIYDSTIDHVAAYDAGLVYIENSRIRWDIEVKGSNTIVYGYGVTNRNTGQDFQVYELDGGQYIQLDSPGAPWDTNEKGPSPLER